MKGGSVIDQTLDAYIALKAVKFTAMVTEIVELLGEHVHIYGSYSSFYPNGIK